MDQAPFAFLAEPELQFTREEQTSRGNRIRGSVWKKLFAELAPVDSEVLSEYRLPETTLPTTIDSSISHLGKDDLRVNQLTVIARKSGNDSV
jgi:hypothetical protein